MEVGKTKNTRRQVKPHYFYCPDLNKEIRKTKQMQRKFYFAGKARGLVTCEHQGKGAQTKRHTLARILCEPSVGISGGRGQESGQHLGGWGTPALWASGAEGPSGTGKSETEILDG